MGKSWLNTVKRNQEQTILDSSIFSFKNFLNESENRFECMKSLIDNLGYFMTIYISIKNRDRLNFVSSNSIHGTLDIASLLPKYIVARHHKPDDYVKFLDFDGIKDINQHEIRDFKYVYEQARSKDLLDFLRIFVNPDEKTREVLQVFFESKWTRDDDLKKCLNYDWKLYKKIIGKTIEYYSSDDLLEKVVNDSRVKTVLNKQDKDPFAFNNTKNDVIDIVSEYFEELIEAVFGSGVLEE